MDNITHSLTGALAAKIVETDSRLLSRVDTGNLLQPETDARRKSVYRTLFWLMVVCANLPDIDVLVNNLIGDPFSVIRHHRGITHSLLFAPVLSFAPALFAYLVSPVKNLKILWIAALIGVYLHIFFDLITSFGTQLFAPLSAARYSMDWMFIIDPFFTITLTILLALGRWRKRHKRAYALAGGLFVLSYLLMEMFSHSIAYNRVAQTAKERGIVAERVSALAQPLSIFRWRGIVQASDAVYEMQLSTFDYPELPAFTRTFQAENVFVKQALILEEATWFMKFARHPLIQYREDTDKRIVEMRDLQFSFDPEMAKTVGDALGIAESERRMPFILQFEFSPEGELLATRFNR